MIKTNLLESIKIYNKAVKVEKSGNLNEAEKLYLDAIKTNPVLFQAHYNLANVKKKTNCYNEAILHYKKSIELNSNFIAAYNNLGSVLKDLGKIDEAEKNFKIALKLKPNLNQTKINYESILDLKKLTKIVQPSKRNKKNLNLVSNLNTFMSERMVENELVHEIYNLRSDELDKEKNFSDARYGNGKFSNFKLFENNSKIIQKVKTDLTSIMEQAVKSKIYIKESFYNILKTDSGTQPHNHISPFDRNFGYKDQKFSLTYYLTVGDQKASEPGILKLYNPEKEILPKNGQILIFPAHQIHGAIYNGKKDRIMIGVNFYSLN